MKNMMAIVLGVLALTSSSAGWGADLRAVEVWRTEAKFRQPESVVFDARREVLYVSNVDGEALAKDGAGFISRLKPDGTIGDLRWVEGLNAPKGMAIVGDTLYVSDIDSLVEIDIVQGKVVRRHAAPGAKFLNDVTADAAGRVYVSDMMADTIHRLDQGTFSVWLQDSRLEAPNGLLAAGDRLYVGAWGVLSEGFKTTVPGRVKVVSLKDKSIGDFGSPKPVANLDGIELLPDGSILATDWMAGGLLTVSPSGEVKQLLDLGQGSADHEYVATTRQVLIPMMKDGIVIAYRLDGI